MKTFKQHLKTEGYKGYVGDAYGVGTQVQNSVEDGSIVEAAAYGDGVNNASATVTATANSDGVDGGDLTVYADDQNTEINAYAQDGVTNTAAIVVEADGVLIEADDDGGAGLYAEASNGVDNVATIDVTANAGNVDVDAWNDSEAFIEAQAYDASNSNTATVNVTAERAEVVLIGDGDGDGDVIVDADAGSGAWIEAYAYEFDEEEEYDMETEYIIQGILDELDNMLKSKNNKIRYRAMIMMLYFSNGFNFNQVSRILNITAQAVKRNYRKGVELLVDNMKINKNISETLSYKILQSNLKN